MSITLGINTCFAVKRWPEPHQWASIITEELGLHDCQLSLDLLPPTYDKNDALDYMARAKHAAAERGLTIHSTFTGLGAYSSNLLLSSDPTTRQIAENWYRDVIDLSAATGARGTGGHIGALDVTSAADPTLRADLLADQNDRLLRIAEYAKQAGLEFLLFENLAVTREYGHTIAEAHALEDALDGSAVPWVLCLDLGHPVALDIDDDNANPAAWLASSWRHTPVVQLQQARRRADLHAPFTTANNEIGLIDRDQVLQALGHWNAADIQMFFEVIPAHENPDAEVLDNLKESVHYWQESLLSSTQ